MIPEVFADWTSKHDSIESHRVYIERGKINFLFAENFRLRKVFVTQTFANENKIRWYFKKETLENQSSNKIPYRELCVLFSANWTKPRNATHQTTSSHSRYNRTRLVIYKCFQNEYSVVVFLWERGGSYKTQNEGHMMTRQSNVRVKRPLDETIWCMALYGFHCF